MSVSTIASNFPNQIPGWLGTIALSFDGTVIYSAGELSNDSKLAQKFADLARRVGIYMTLESPQDRQENPFKRLTSRFILRVLSQRYPTLFRSFFALQLCARGTAM